METTMLSFAYLEETADTITKPLVIEVSLIKGVAVCVCDLANVTNQIVVERLRERTKYKPQN